MSIIKFLKERKLNNICMAIILVTMNIYLLSLNSFSGHLNDIVYLDIMIIILYRSNFNFFEMLVKFTYN